MTLPNNVRKWCEKKLSIILGNLFGIYTHCKTFKKQFKFIYAGKTHAYYVN